ncbi:hypothetical protein QFC21_003943 [Naganishia friedmannii]|uniref:Uncharacterized protein n=1 Tax=Naganishia friedmannii TaxID=89922 RepID=A0ACC2VKX5_9TREE|nr:hypothetical protein QFC21_003943 [Naganishia friedmannii]
MKDTPRPTPSTSGYDPTLNPLPPDAIRAPPGERQIAYPPEFPRAKIQGNGTVHLGVRPRSVPAPVPVASSADDNQAAAAAAGTQAHRRPGYGELGQEADPEKVRATNRSFPRGVRVPDDDNDGNIDAREAATTISTFTPAEDRRARPKMTLEQAVKQYDRTHPPSTPSSRHTPSTSTSRAARPSVEEQVKDDVRSHDGVYTYDYSTTPGTTTSSQPGEPKTRNAGAAQDDGDAHARSERGYPEPPVTDEAYGVPFGKRLKAMIKLRGQAERAGLVPSLSSSFEASAALFSASSSLSSSLESLNGVQARSGLTRRPATSGAVDSVGGRREAQGSPRKTKGKAAERTTVADAGYRDGEADGRSSTPSTPRPFATSRRPRQISSPPRSEQFGTTTSTSTPTAAARANIRRKPVPEYVIACSPSRVSTESESTQLLKKQKSEPGMGGGGDSAARVGRREKRRREKERDRGANDSEVMSLAMAAKRKHGRSQSDQPHLSTDSRSQRDIPGTTEDDPYYMPLKGLSARSQSQLVHGTEIRPRPPASGQIALRGGLEVPPMPEGEEYDSETEAERQAAWEEYYRLQAVAAAAAGMFDGSQKIGYDDGAYPAVEEWVDTQSQTQTNLLHAFVFSPNPSLTMFMYPPPFFGGPIHHSPGFPYNVGAVPEFTTAAPGKMPAVRPPPMGSMGAPMGPMGMPIHPGQQQQPPMFYGFQHPGMMPPQHMMGGGEYGPMGMDPGAYEGEVEYAAAQRHPGVPIAGPPARAKHSARPVPMSSNSRRDVRFAGVSEAPPKLATRHSGYTGWRYPAQQGAYMSQEHTPVSSAMTSPTADSADPMEAYSPRGSYAQQGYYGYSPYPSYPNTPSVNSGAGYNAQSDPFNFEEMSNAVHQAAVPKQKGGEQHSLQDRRKKSWYGPRQ